MEIEAHSGRPTPSPKEIEAHSGWPTPSPKEIDAPSGGPTPSPKEDRMKLLVAKVKAEWAERAAIYAAEKATREKRLLEEDSGEDDDYYAVEASKFRDTWNKHYSRYYGCFEDSTKIPNMRFTYVKPEPRHAASPHTTLQIFSLKVSRITGGLQWPLQVFEMVAIRDSIDHNRNIIFDRPRDNCQILTREVPYLKLTGPMRAVVLLDRAIFEVDLKVKGATEPEDECLSFLATYINFSQLDSRQLTRDFTSRLSTLEFELGSMVSSVEATISLQITKGSWPDGCRALFTACTTSIGCAEVILLDSGNDQVIVDGHYASTIKLSRRVVSVETHGKLKVCVKALQGDKIVVEKEKPFSAKKEGASGGSLYLGFCTLRVTICWSLISSSKV